MIWFQNLSDEIKILQKNSIMQQETILIIFQETQKKELCISYY